jgi:hypothetical protein
MSAECLAGGSGLGKDAFNDVPGVNNTWNIPFKQEIFAINILTLEIKRFCHHRSRALQSTHEPRPSAAWNGGVILLASNMNDSSPTNYADVYGIIDPFASEGGGGGALLSRLHSEGLFAGAGI